MILPLYTNSQYKVPAIQTNYQSRLGPSLVENPKPLNSDNTKPLTNCCTPLKPLKPILSDTFQKENKEEKFPNIQFYPKNEQKIQKICTYPKLLSPSHKISFGYSNPLKTEWKKGRLPEVIYGFYGGKLTKENISLEHLLPHSKGGKTTISNLVLATKQNNQARANLPLIDYLKSENVKQYLAQFEDVQIGKISGKQYIKWVRETIERIIRNELA